MIESVLNMTLIDDGFNTIDFIFFRVRTYSCLIVIVNFVSIRRFHRLKVLIPPNWKSWVL